MGGDPVCKAGVDIRAHVGGELFGWLARTPCLRAHHGKEGVRPCAMYDDSDQEERDAEVSRVMDEYLAGRCPTCGGDLERAGRGRRCASGCDFWALECGAGEHGQ